MGGGPLVTLGKKKKKIRLEKDRGGELAYKKRLRDRRRVKRDQDREREREREKEGARWTFLSAMV